MKRENRYIAIPMSLWENQDLTWLEKVVLIEIDSYPRSELGVNVRSGALATALEITKKECDATLRSLFDKGAVQVNIDEGQKLILPLVYKSEYRPTNQPKVIEGEKPETLSSIDYDDVSKKWAESCPTLPPITRWTPQRKRKLKSCMNQGELTIGDLYKIFKLVGSSSFLCGNANTDWRCTFDWLIKSAANATKVYEGAYHNRDNEKYLYDKIMSGEDVLVKKDDGNEDYWQ
jgi:hypothetical protein